MEWALLALTVSAWLITLICILLYLAQRNYANYLEAKIAGARQICATCELEEFEHHMMVNEAIRLSLVEDEVHDFRPAAVVTLDGLPAFALEYYGDSNG